MNVPDFLIRVGGLLSVTVIAVLVAACGLTLAFGLYDISKLIFLVIVVLLITIKVILKLKS